MLAAPKRGSLSVRARYKKISRYKQIIMLGCQFQEEYICYFLGPGIWKCPRTGSVRVRVRPLTVPVVTHYIEAVTGHRKQNIYENT